MIKRLFFAASLLVVSLMPSISTNACSISVQRVEQFNNRQWVKSATEQITWSGNNTDTRICVASGNTVTVISTWRDDPYEGHTYSFDWDVESQIGDKVEVKFDNKGTLSAKDDEPELLWRYTY